MCNGAEGEPGTFKDRALIRANPYQLVEGVVIAGFAVGIEEAFICLEASFGREIELVTRAVEKFQTAGICGDCKVTIVAGPDEYLLGEEKAMLEVIEGIEGMVGWLGHIADGSRCYLATEERIVVDSILWAFPEEFDDHIALGRCPRPRRLPIPKLVDLSDGHATYDESIWRQRPDWTYDPS